MAIGVRYLPVRGIIDDLLAEGQRVSVGAVRERLGSGSNQVISAMIKDRLQALGRLPQDDAAPLTVSPAPTVPIPVPDPAAIAGKLQVLRWETNMARAEKMAERFIGGSTNGTR